MKKSKLSLSRFFAFILFCFGWIAIAIVIILLMHYVSNKYLYLGFFIVYTLNLISTVIIYKQNTQINTKLNWITLIFLVPILGLIIFLTFGLFFINKKELKIKDDPKYQIQTYEEKQIITPSNRFSHELEFLQNIELNHSLPGTMHFYEECYDFYKALFEKIKQAKKNICIISYIIKKSEIFEQLYHLLEKKIKEGIKVYWIIDDFGLNWSPRQKIKKLKQKGLKYCILGKINYPFINGSSFLRNHQKIFIIDSEIVFTGGANISDEYISLSTKYGHWVDISYHLTGPITNKYNLHFLRFWKIITQEDLSNENYQFFNQLKHKNFNKYKNDVILVLDSPNLPDSLIEYYWLKLFNAAKKSIKIATPYFAITEALKKSLILALKNKIDITVYFPGLPDKKIIHKISLSQLKELQQYGLKVQIYQDVFLHSKIGLIDNKIAWVGSSNMDSRSLYSQYENLDLFSGKNVKDIIKIFKSYDAKSIDLKNDFKLNTKPNKFEKFIYDLTKTLI